MKPEPSTESIQVGLRDRAIALCIIMGSLLIAGFVFYICDPDFKIPEFLRPQPPPPKGAFFQVDRSSDQIHGATMFFLTGMASPIFLLHFITSKKWGYILGGSIVIGPILALVAMFLFYGSIGGAAYCLIFMAFYTSIVVGLYRLSRRLAVMRSQGVAGLLRQRG